MRSVSFTAGNQITLLHSGAEFFPALIAAIDAAQTEVYLETYIFAEDETGEQVKTALMCAARRGVRVNVITDWVGTGHRRSLSLRAQFHAAYVNHRIFNAWFQRGITCTHRKICVIDRQVAFLGGLNINHDMVSDDDRNTPLPAPRWDFAVRIVGPLVWRIHEEVEAQWKLLGGLNLRYRWEKLRGVWWPRSTSSTRPIVAALVVRDNLRNRRTIQKAYLKALGTARKSAMLATPYFAPGRKLRKGLAEAARRGVQVTLLIGVGQFRIQDAVAHSIYPKLLRAGVRIVEYRKTQLHGKVAVVDEDWATVGSSNWDGLSLLINQEANVVIRDADFTQQLREHIERGIADGVEVKPEVYLNVAWYERLWYGAASIFYRSVLRVLAFGKYEE
jgi:cardiolipin synthase